MAGSVREPPREFEAKLKRMWPDFRRIEWDTQYSRWRFFFTSAAGRESSWLYMWDRDPRTGLQPAPTDPVTGLRPFRELDAQAQAEIIYHGERTSLTNPFDGPGSWENHTIRHMKEQKATLAKRKRDSAEDYAYALQQVDLRRPWLKLHQPQKRGTGPRVGYTGPTQMERQFAVKNGIATPKLAPFGKGRKTPISTGAST